MLRFLRRKPPVPAKPVCLIEPRSAAKGVILNGEVGAGKTTILLELMREWARAEERVHFACTTVKPTDADDYERLLRKAGRDPLRITADGSFRISPFIHELTRPGGGARNLSSLHQDLLEVISRSDSSRTETFWKSITEETNLYAFELAHLVRGSRARYSDVADVIMSIPQSADEAASDSFRTSTKCGQFLADAYAVDPKKATVIADHFLKRLPAVGEKARGAAVTGAMQSIQPFITPPISNIVDGVPTHTVADLLDRDTIWAIDTHTYGKNGLAMQLILAWLCMEEVLRRKGDFDYLCLVRDEYGHTAFAERDIRTQSTGRSQKFIGLSAIQSIPTLESQLGGDLEAATDAKALYGLHVHKIMCRQSDQPTAEMNANIIGHERKMFFSGGSQNRPHQEPEWWDMFGVGEQQTFGFNQQWHFRCPPITFQTLKAGGPEFDFEVEAIVYDGSDNFFRHSFFQR
ncbi:MAG: hypothetical protein KDB27_29720 [Planctomycetales bacterium]|nr:hypothetical protein [Planctomycetales bacterium]